jgi:hypothetical protein
MTNLQSKSTARNTTYDLPMLPSDPHSAGPDPSTRYVLQKDKQPTTMSAIPLPVPQIQTPAEPPGDENQHHHARTRTQGNEMPPGKYSYFKGGWESTGYAPWLSPHTVEHQKRLWYHESLGMGTPRVGDDWGFSSASVSRSQSPTRDIYTTDEGVTSGQK